MNTLADALQGGAERAACAVSHAVPGADPRAAGLPPGTPVITAEGILPVEYLCAGDRIVTRAGMRVLSALHRIPATGARMIRVAQGAVGHGRPDDAVVLPGALPVLVRDWRAAAMFGASRAVVALDRLADGKFIADAGAAGADSVFLLPVFEADAVIHVAGLDIVLRAAATPAGDAVSALRSAAG